MARKSGRGKLALSAEERERLRQLSGSRTAPKREVERAHMLLRYADGADIAGIARKIKVTRATVYQCIDKALAAGVETGLNQKITHWLQSCGHFLLWRSLCGQVL